MQQQRRNKRAKSDDGNNGHLCPDLTGNHRETLVLCLIGKCGARITGHNETRSAASEYSYRCVRAESCKYELSRHHSAKTRSQNPTWYLPTKARVGRLLRSDGFDRYFDRYEDRRRPSEPGIGSFHSQSQTGHSRLAEVSLIGLTNLRRRVYARLGEVSPGCLRASKFLKDIQPKRSPEKQHAIQALPRNSFPTQTPDSSSGSSRY